jgi:hypothetical protein
LLSESPGKEEKSLMGKRSKVLSSTSKLRRTLSMNESDDKVAQRESVELDQSRVESDLLEQRHRELRGVVFNTPIPTYQLK